jgi:DNA-binding transcriptional ArsR family regulator
MSHRIRSTGSTRHSAAEHALLFAALGDETRLRLLAKLAGAEPASISQLSISQLSISQLTAGSGMTRQAITKHLRVLEKTSIVRCTRQGRESLYALDLEPLVELRAYLEQMSRAWDDRLSRLKVLVESDG